MKKIILVSIMILSLFLVWCTSNQKLEQLKQENSILKNQLWISETSNVTSWTETKPNIARLTVSRIWWALSRQTSIIWEQIYFNPDLWDEIYPINSEEVAKDFIWYYFNSAGDLLIASCNEWYVMRDCRKFWDTDNVSKWIENQCMLQNENPDLMRTSMIIECAKM